jgi:multiple sugar transport system permease protein
VPVRGPAVPGQAVALAMVLPAVALALLVIGWPIVDTARLALHDVSRFGQLRGFVGLANFHELWADPLLAGAAWRTLVWTAAVVGGTVLLALPVALALDDDFPGRGLLRVIVMLPWAVSLTMNAVVWRWALNGQYGMVNRLLSDLGLITGPVEWLATAGTAFPIAIAIGILVSIPFTVTVLLGGLASLPREIYEAARIDGAGAWARFTRLTLPLLRPFIDIAVVLNVIYVFNSFPIIWVLTQGEPAGTTDILVTYLYKLAFRYGKLDVAAALSLVMLALLLVVTALYARLAMRGRPG